MHRRQASLLRASRWRERGASASCQLLQPQPLVSKSGCLLKPSSYRKKTGEMVLKGIIVEGAGCHEGAFI